jgi:hypothetical protein
MDTDTINERRNVSIETNIDNSPPVCKYCLLSQSELGLDNILVNPCYCTNPICRNCFSRQTLSNKNHMCEICKSILSMPIDVNENLPLINIISKDPDESDGSDGSDGSDEADGLECIKHSCVICGILLLCGLYISLGFYIWAM